jgi:(1->4)-alpha-D-glucan 1-alpha-D-glucosylmutase
MMTATYRLQLHPDFRFEHVQALLPYFKALGVSHLYLSPITEARKGSLHGYDVVDHNAIRQELGGRDGFLDLADACNEADLKLIIDFVPNHAGVGPRNRYWQDVLAFGPHSPHAKVFDIDWRPLKSELHDKIHLPFLGRPYGGALDDGELGIVYEHGAFYASYYESRFALNPGTYHAILLHILESHEREDAYFELKPIVEAYASLDRPEREKAHALGGRLSRVLESLGVDGSIEGLSTDVLHAIFEAQFWRLSFWKTASSQINYRRFFDINELVALRMEEPAVFWDAHRLLSELLSHPAIGGVRIDHVDGLSDPHSYLNLLTELGMDHIWVEKIVAPGEVLPDDWPTEGTTGYEFMNDVLGVLVDEAGKDLLDRTYRRAVPAAASFEDEVYRSKKLVMETSLYSELFRLAYELDRLSEADYHTRDFTLGALQDALQEIVAGIDRYRTYLPHDVAGAREVIGEAVYRALARNPLAEPSVYEFVRSIILGDVKEDLKEDQQRWVTRFQQYSAPVAAKGVEDTSFYRYYRLVALNEVGGEPGHFGMPLQAYHSRARFRAMRYPRMLLSTATHDHKRGEDTRMRIVALSEIADEWESAVRELDDVAQRHRPSRGDVSRDAYLFYQTAVGLWPGSEASEDEWSDIADRIWQYMEKASRESKLNTSWINPDSDYEQALDVFIRAMLRDSDFRAALEPVATRAATLGFRNSLTQQVLKLTTPGVPDVYQGAELLDLSLVDPDNRRPVDYDMRLNFVKEIDAASDQEDADLFEEWLRADDPRAKFLLIKRLLRLRQDHPHLFAGGYSELEPEGPAADTWIAFSRQSDDSRLLVAARRYFSRENAAATLSLPDELADTTFYDVLTGETITARPTIDLETLRFPWLVAVSHFAD